MDSPLIYILCTSREIGRLSVEVDGHIDPKHKALRYVTAPEHLCGIPRESLYVDLLHRGRQSRHESEILAMVRAIQGQPIEIWKLKAKLRYLGIEG